MESNQTELLIRLVQDVNRERLMQEETGNKLQFTSKRLLTKNDMEVLLRKSNYHEQQPLFVQPVFINDTLLLEDQIPDFSSEDILDNETAAKVHSYSNSLVKPEEAVIVVIVLLIWIGVILLFIRKWGKIRGLEPYTPTFDRNNSTTMPLTPSPVVIHESPSPVFDRCHRSNSKEAPKFVHDNRNRIHQHQSGVFHFPSSSSSSSSSSRVAMPKFTPRPYSISASQRRRPTKSLPDIRFTTVSITSPSKSPPKKALSLHKPPHLRKHVEFTSSQTSLN